MKTVYIVTTLQNKHLITTLQQQMNKQYNKTTKNNNKRNK